MNKFTYWSNKNAIHDEKLFEWVGDSILQADEQLKLATGFVAAKCGWIGCEIKETQ